MKTYYRIFTKEQKIGSIIKINPAKRAAPWPQARIAYEAFLHEFRPSDYPSRYTCFFVFDNTYDLEKFLENDWKNQFKNYFIYELEIMPISKIVKLDANYISFIYSERKFNKISDEKAEQLAKDYWAGKTIDEMGEPIFEILFDGKAKVVKQYDI